MSADRRIALESTDPPRRAELAPGESDRRVPRQLTEEIIQTWVRDARMLGDRPHAGVLLAHAGEAAEFAAQDRRRAAEFFARAAEHPDRDPRAFAGRRRLARQANDRQALMQAWEDELEHGADAGVQLLAALGLAQALMRESAPADRVLAVLRGAKDLVGRAPTDAAALWRAVLDDAFLYAGRPSDGLKVRTQRWNDARSHAEPDPAELAAEAVAVAVAAEQLGADAAVSRRWYETALEHAPGEVAVRALVRRALDAGDGATAAALATEFAAHAEEPDTVGRLHYELAWLRESLSDAPGAIAAMATAARGGRSAPVSALAFLGLTRRSDANIGAGEVVDALGVSLDFAATPIERADLLVQMAARFDGDLGMSEAAVEMARDALNLVPTFRPAIRLLGTLYSRMARFKDLVELQEHELQQESDPAERVRLHERVAGAYLDDLHDTANAERHLRAALQIAPHLPVVRRLARLLAEQHRWADLLDHLTTTVGRVQSQRERAYMLEQAAELAETRLRDFERAIAIYRDLLSLRADHPGAISSLGRLLSQTSQWRELLELNELELSLNGRDTAGRVAVLCRSAEIARRYLGDANLSEEFFRRALEDAPTNDEALRGLGALLTSQRRWDDLVQITEREMASARTAAHRARCLLQLGEMYATRLESPADAVRCFEELSRSTGTLRHEALLWLERLYPLLGAWDDALGVLSRRLEVVEDPVAVARIEFRRGELLEWRLGRPAEAFAAYVAALHDPLPASGVALGAIDRLWCAAGVDKALHEAALAAADALAEHSEAPVRIQALELLANRAAAVRGQQVALDAWLALHGEEPSNAVAAEICAMDALRRGDFRASERRRSTAPVGAIGAARARWAMLDDAVSGVVSTADAGSALPTFAALVARDTDARAGFAFAPERELFARIGEGRVALGDLRNVGDGETMLRLAAMANAALGDYQGARRQWSALADALSDPMRATRVRIDFAAQDWVGRDERSRWLRDAASVGCWDPPLRDELYGEFRAAKDLDGLEDALAAHLRGGSADSATASELSRQRATCLDLLGRRDEAIEALRFSAIHAPGDADVALEKSRLETMADRVDDARATLEDCLAEGVSGVARLKVLGRLSDLHQMAGGSHARAISALEDAVRLSGEAREWGLRLASAHATFGDPRRAVELLERLLVRPPQDDEVRYWHMLARAYSTKLDRREEAERVLWDVFLAHPGRKGAVSGLEEFYRRFSGASVFADRLADALAAGRLKVDADTAADLWTYVGELNLSVLRRWSEAEAAFGAARRAGGTSAGLLLREARAVSRQSARARDAARLVVDALEIAQPDLDFWEEAAHELESLFGELNDVARLRVAQQLRRTLGATVEGNDEWVKRDPTRTLDQAAVWGLLGQGLVDDADRVVLSAASGLAERVMARLGARHPANKGKRIKGGDYAAFEAFLAAAAQWVGGAVPKVSAAVTANGIHFIESGHVAVPAGRVGIDTPIRARFWAGFSVAMSQSQLGAYSWADEYSVRDMLRALAARALGAPYAASDEMSAEVGGLLLAGARRSAAPALRDHLEILDRSETNFTSTATWFSDRAGLVFCGDLAVAIEEILWSQGWEADLAEARTREHVLQDGRTSALIRWAMTDAYHLIRYESGLAPRPSLFD